MAGTCPVWVPEVPPASLTVLATPYICDVCLGTDGQPAAWGCKELIGRTLVLEHDSSGAHVKLHVPKPHANETLMLVVQESDTKGMRRHQPPRDLMK